MHYEHPLKNASVLTASGVSDVGPALCGGLARHGAPERNARAQTELPGRPLPQTRSCGQHDCGSSLTFESTTRHGGTL